MEVWIPGVYVGKNGEDLLIQQSREKGGSAIVEVWCPADLLLTLPAPGTPVVITALVGQKYDKDKKQYKKLYKIAKKLDVKR